MTAHHAYPANPEATTGQAGAWSVPHQRGPVRHPQPMPGATVGEPIDSADPGTPVRHDPVAVHIRNQVIHRMVAMNRNHAGLAWDNRRAQQICPHGVAFLYADPLQQRRSHTLQLCNVVAATRVVHDTEDVREAADLLYRLAALARSRYLPTPGGFDPAVQMAIHRDASSGNAHYIGLGLSTLDTLEGQWYQLYPQADDVDDIGGRCMAILLDGTAILIDRGPHRQVRSDIGVHATADLNFEGGFAPFDWTHHPDLSRLPVSTDIWRRMQDLHQITLNQHPRPSM